MTTLQIDTDDKSKIDELISFAFEKFNFKIEIKDENKTKKRTISSHLDDKLKKAKSTNTQKAVELKNALNGLGELMDKESINLSLNQAKEEYFLSKAK